MTVAEILPAALAPVPVVILAACLLMSLIVPGSSGRLPLLVAIGASATTFVLWATSDATTCDASCSTGQEALTLGALAIGPGVVLLLLLVAAFRIGAGSGPPPDTDGSSAARVEGPREPDPQEEAPRDKPGESSPPQV